MRVRHAIVSISSLAFYFSHFAPNISRHHQRHKPLAYSMASVSVNFTADATAASAVDNDANYGFRRPEMFRSKLSGTVSPPYDRHVFLCYKSHEVWPSRIEVADDDPLPKLFAGALNARKSDINVKTLFTICEGAEDIGLSEGDVLVFPEMIKYRGLKESDVNDFVEDVLVSGKPWSSGMQESLTGSFVFVCAHNNRDKRCGVCGPALIERFKEEIEAKDLKNKVYVTACSHIGGHKYAGNLIIFSADSEGKIAGNWYGYVTPDDVSELLYQHIGKGEIIRRIWRGQMGMRVEETDKLEELVPVNGTTLNNNEEKPQEIGSKERKENVVSCCQGANDIQCFRDGGSEDKPEQKGVSRLFDWTAKWEHHEVLTAASVVGAVANVAYAFYRNSR